MEATERASLQEAQSPTEEKEPKLKCHEMRLIFQRLPTSELIRFITRQPNHPLGKFWSQELNYVVQKRLPFSYTATVIPRGPVSDHVILDCNGSRVAEIKRPEQFYLSPICELVERAAVPAVSLNVSSRPPHFVFPIPDMLSILTNLDTLFVSTHDMILPNMRDHVDLTAVLSHEIMSRIKSFTLAHDWSYETWEKPLLAIISRATNLKKLNMPRVGLSLSEQILLASLPPDLAGHYSSLESMSIKHMDADWVVPFLEIITTRFNGLRELFVPLRAPIRQYLAAFQALPSLATLGLNVRHFFGNPQFNRPEVEKIFAVDENDPPAVSVTELIIACWPLDEKGTGALLATLAKFPNVRTFGADFSLYVVADFASSVCAGGVFRHLQALKLFSDRGRRRRYTPLPSDALLPFIRANIDHLPSSVDLSRVETDCPRNVDCDFLVDLSTALQTGRVTSLALKDLVHRDAVPRLREHFASMKQDKSTSRAKVGKISAWIDEESSDERRIQSSSAGWPEAVSDFTDFRIEACKTSGPLKGSLFIVRVSNWTQKRERLFDV